MHKLEIIEMQPFKDRKQHLESFLDEYKKGIGSISSCNDIYIYEFQNAILNNEIEAEAKLYYSKTITLCKETCHTHLT